MVGPAGLWGLILPPFYLGSSPARGPQTRTGLQFPLTLTKISGWMMDVWSLKRLFTWNKNVFGNLVINSHTFYML